MTQTTNKLNLKIRKAITEATPKVCKFQGVSHLSYTVEWNNFPASLIVTCFLNTNDELAHILATEQNMQLMKIIQLSLIKVGVKFRDVRKNVEFEVAKSEKKTES